MGAGGQPRHAPHRRGHRRARLQDLPHLREAAGVSGLSALVLAGSRPGAPDPVAASEGVAHKALARLGGETLLARVVAAVRAAGAERVIVSASDPAVRAAAAALQAQVLEAEAGPSASVAAALDAVGAPLLVTTADHALLQPHWVRRFLADAPAEADVSALLARRPRVEAAAPGARRTYINLRGGGWSGCNLFYLATPEARRAVDVWRRVEAQRKRPWRIARMVGPGALLAYASGALSPEGAARRISQATGARAALVESPYGLCAVDVDTPGDLALARRLLAEGAAALSPDAAR
ncbi:MAG: nucleotidyltransferase family protein [Caulobacteraceae bacterium]|nr:nucleotidyltransferase family protein [Caulobacter sp.]